MGRRPVVGSDEGTWGTIDNEWCRVEHNANGTHNDPMCYLNHVVCNEDQVLTNQTDFSAA